MVIRDDEKFMRIAIDLAKEAFAAGEVPVGAVVVKDGEVIGKGINETEVLKDPTAHAEIIAIQEAAEKLGNWRLSGCTIYVTKEPCQMCAGAIYQARLQRLVYGCPEEKANYNYHVETEGGVLTNECRILLQQFFQSLR